MPEFNRLTADEDLEEGLAEEVAIVPQGAVGRTIAFRKEHPMKIADILKACADVPIENEAELEKVLKETGLEGEALEAAKAIARLTSAYADKLSPDAVVKALNATAGKGDDAEAYAVAKAKDKGSKADDEDDEDEPPFPGAAKPFGKELIALVEKLAGGRIKKQTRLGSRLARLMEEKDVSAAALGRAAGISEGTVGQILRGDIERPPEQRIRGFARALSVSADSLMRLLPEEKDVKKSDNSPSAVLARIAKGDTTVDLSVIEDAETRAALQIMKAQTEAKDAELAEIRKDLKAETDRRVMKELTEEVEKKFSHLPGAKAEELAKTLKELRGSSPEAAARMEKLLADSSDAIAKGAAFAEMTGDTFHTAAASNAISRVEMAADAILKSGEKDAQSGKPLTKDQAIDLAIQRDPGLYHEYTEEAGISDFHNSH